jgi:predicted RNA polymerase sigma factor
MKKASRKKTTAPKPVPQPMVKPLTEHQKSTMYLAVHALLEVAAEADGEAFMEYYASLFPAELHSVVIRSRRIASAMFERPNAVVQLVDNPERID